MAKREEQESISDILTRLTQQRRSRVVTGLVRGGRRTDILTVGTRGRYVKHRTPKDDKVKDIALMPTIKSAIMRTGGKDLSIKPVDFKEKVRRRKISSLLCVLIDTSSSMLQGGKMRTARKVFQEILLDAYQKRDRVSVVTFSGQQSDVVLPFTTGVEQGQKRLDDVDFGGTTPLSRGMNRGIDMLALKMKQERHTIPILVLITDGIANTPMTEGSDIGEDMELVFRKLEDTSIRFVAVDVGEGEDELRELTENAGGVYYKPETISSEEIFEDYTEMRTLRNIMAEVLVHQGLGHLVIVDEDDTLFPLVMNDLEDVEVSRHVVDGCFYKCDPERPDLFCRECRIKYEKEKPPAKDEIARLVKLDLKKDFYGSPYVRYIILPGQVEEARRGILAVPNIDSIKRDDYLSLVDPILKGKRKVEGALGELEYPILTTLVTSVKSKEDIPPELKNLTLRVFDPDDIPEKNRLLSIISQQKEFERDPEGFARNLRKERDQTFQEETKLFQQGTGLKWNPDAKALLEDVSSPAEKRHLRALARRRAAMRKHQMVLPEDLRAVSALEEGKKYRGEGINPFILAWYLLPALMFRSLDRVLVTDISRETLTAALDIMRAVLPDVDAVQGCQFNCHPEGKGGFCYPCQLKKSMGKLTTESNAVPFEIVEGDETLAEIVGERYVKYVFKPGILAKANRGIVFVDEPEKLNGNALSSIIYSSESGLNFPLGSGRQMSHPSVFKLILRSDDIEDVPSRVLSYVSYRIDRSDIDESRTVSEEDLRNVVTRIEALSEVEVTEADLDLVSRLCDQLNVPGNILERNIIDMAKSLAFLEGQSDVEKKNMERALNLCLFDKGESLEV